MHDASGIENDIVLKTPIEATVDARSALKCEHNSYKAVLFCSVFSIVSVMNECVEKCPKRYEIW